MPSASRRIQRIHIPSIDVTFRDDITVTTLDVWREDRLTAGESTYLVLDFGVEETIEFQNDNKPEEDQVWRPSGRVLVEVQAIDPATGKGLSLPTFKEIAGELGAVVAWHDWTLLPISPRRPAETDTPPEVDDLHAACLMCGSPDVVHHETDGSARCQQHVGEAPRLSTAAFLHYLPLVGRDNIDAWMEALSDEDVADIEVAFTVEEPIDGE